MKKIFLFVWALVGMTTAVAENIDQRQVLPLHEEQRDHLLDEMRMLLTGTNAILEALARDDMQAVARHARLLGVGMPHKVEGHMDHVMPEQFMRMGMMMHQAFDKVAQDAESGKDIKHILHQLNNTLKNCTACHAIYQIGTASLSDGQNVHEGHEGHEGRSHGH